MIFTTLFRQSPELAGFNTHSLWPTTLQVADLDLNANMQHPVFERDLAMVA